MCVGCGGQIHDQYILRVAPDLEWHATCLKCAECGRYLDESCTCFVREGKTYCKKDYLRLFGARCAKCKEGFSKNDFVMRARSKIYHIECFRCVACSRQLIPGDEYALRDDGLLCKADNDILGKPNNGTKGDGSPNGGSTDYNGNRTHQANGYNDSSSNEEQPTNNKGSHGGSSGKNGTRKDKTTRVRTVLNEKQLHTLRTCYAANPRPDALMKEQLVEMTSLSPRVIRVWFQNKRCKDKKKSILMKQIHETTCPTCRRLPTSKCRPTSRRGRP